MHNPLANEKTAMRDIIVESIITAMCNEAWGKKEPRKHWERNYVRFSLSEIGNPLKWKSSECQQAKSPDITLQLDSCLILQYIEELEVSPLALAEFLVYDSDRQAAMEEELGSAAPTDLSMYMATMHHYLDNDGSWIALGEENTLMCGIDFYAHWDCDFVYLIASHGVYADSFSRCRVFSYTGGSGSPDEFQGIMHYITDGESCYDPRYDFEDLNGLTPPLFECPVTRDSALRGLGCIYVDSCGIAYGYSGEELRPTVSR